MNPDDLKKLNLDKWLRPLDGFAPQENATAMEWDAQHDRNVVRAMHLQSVSFSVLTGGTASLGGRLNGDGLLIVNNSTGSQVVRLDNTGIVITAGTISGVTVTNVNSGTYSNITINGNTNLSGSVTNTGQLSGGTLALVRLVSGSVNPTQYQTGGTPAVNGSIIYVKTVNFAGSAVTLGTTQFNGIVYANA